MPIYPPRRLHNGMRAGRLDHTPVKVVIATDFLHRRRYYDERHVAIWRGAKQIGNLGIGKNVPVAALAVEQEIPTQLFQMPVDAEIAGVIASHSSMWQCQRQRSR